MCAEMLSQINIVITGPCLTQTLPRGLFVGGSFDNIIIKHYIFLKPVCLRIHESLNSEYPGGCLGVGQEREIKRGGKGRREQVKVKLQALNLGGKLSFCSMYWVPLLFQAIVGRKRTWTNVALYCLQMDLGCCALSQTWSTHRFGSALRCN